MSVQPPSICEELSNGLHLLALLDKETEVLRCKFHKYYSSDPKTLYNEISKHKPKLKKLMKQKVIRRIQYDILLPPTGRTDSSKFDLTLLTLALRVLCPIQAPVTGWETLPLPSDQTEGANLVRLRIGRNELIHTDFKYESNRYTNVWNRTASALEGLGCNKQELINLKTSSLDPNTAKELSAKLSRLKAGFTTCS